MVPPYAETESLFDLSLMQQQQDELRPSQTRKRQDLGDDYGSTSAVVSDWKASLDQYGSEDDSLPLMDSITADTAIAEDDSSVSTFGSVASTSRRSVFSKYWNATGQVPATIRKRADSCSPAKSSQQPQRRSIIFSPSSHGSFHSLPGVMETEPLTVERKSVSVGDLSTGSHRSRGPLQSCLRRDPHYSGEHSHRKPCSSMQSFLNQSSSINEEDDMTADDSSSVRFDLDATAVRHFTLPEEVHAEQGWSSYFH